MTKTAIVPYFHDRERQQYEIRVSSEAWPFLRDLLIKAGEVMECGVEFNEIQPPASPLENILDEAQAELDELRRKKGGL